MKTFSSDTKDTLKRQRRRYWLGCLTILLVSPLLLYYGYCWGLWGRQSLLLQYLFQCNCSAASTESRYPEKVDVVVSACRYGSSVLSPSGQLLYVEEGDFDFFPAYVLDLQTNEKVLSNLGEGSNYFLTDDLLFLSLEYGHEGYEGGDYILDRTTGKQYPIQSFRSLRNDAFVNNQPNLELLAIELRDAKDVYLIDNDTIVALKLNFQTSPESNFYINSRDLPGRSDPNRAEQFLQENQIDYHVVWGLFQEDALSPDGRFIASMDGIYLAGSGERIVEAYALSGLFLSDTEKYFSVKGWFSDSSGVIYAKFQDPCLVEPPSYDGEGGCFWRVPQPLIKLKVPEEYLLSGATP